MIVMTNGDNTGSLFTYLQIAVAEEYKWEYFRPRVYEPIVLNDVDLNTFTGQFNWDDKFVIITNEHDVLFIQINNERYELIPVGKSFLIVFA